MVLTRVPMGTGAVGDCIELSASPTFCLEEHVFLFLLACSAVLHLILLIPVVFQMSWIFVAPYTD